MAKQYFFSEKAGKVVCEDCFNANPATYKRASAAVIAEAIRSDLCVRCANCDRDPELCRG
jgi:hypothetical protein